LTLGRSTRWQAVTTADNLARMTPSLQPPPPGAVPRPGAPHPDFASLAESWQLTLNSDGYSPNTVRAYTRALGQLARWLAVEHPDVGPVDVTRDHVRGWLVHVRTVNSSGTARGWFAGVRHFLRWLVTEGETDVDPTDGIRTPAPNQPETPVASDDDIRALLKTCTGRTFLDRRDTAILYVFIDGGLRIHEVAGLTVEAVDVRSGLIQVVGKASNRSGPRRRSVPLGTDARIALDRYLRERRKHPYVERPQLWLGARNRSDLSISGIERMIKARVAQAGIKLHPHILRHTWASAYRTAGGSEGDLMVMGGWRSRAMLDRYGKAAASERAAEDYRKRSFGDRIGSGMRRR
jgi:site-specific recombinase XerD